jgi:type IV pilus assembly protein PilC
MAQWVWEARTKAGELKKGTLEAPDEKSVHSKLRMQQLVPIRVRKKGAISFDLAMLSGISDKDLVIFTRQFSTMIDAGIPLVTGLDILGNQMENRRFRVVLKSVKEEVEGGSTFSEALRLHPKVFDDLFVNMVAAGEAGGILDTILNRLATHIEKRTKLKKQVTGAMVYPTFVIIVGVIVTTIMLWFVIPTFEGLFDSMGSGAKLPGPTRFVIALSRGFVRVGPFVIGAIILFVVAFVFFYRTAGGRFIVHKFILFVPLVGTVVRKMAVARFTRTLGTLLSSGVPILDALEIVARATGNAVIEKAVLFARDKISEGKTMAEPLGQAGVFPGMVVEMISVGEQAGALDQMCNKIADFYEEDVDVAVAAMTSALEPVLMVGVGGVVGGLMIAMYLPIFNLAGNIKSE